MIAEKRTRVQYYTPNSGTAIKAKWKNEGRIKAIGLITCAGGIMSGKALASFLGVSPRGLRQFLDMDDLFQVEMRESVVVYRGEKRTATEAWYRLNGERLSILGVRPQLLAHENSAPESEQLRIG